MNNTIQSPAPWSTDQTNSLLIAVRLSSTLSILGTIGIITTYLTISRTRTIMNSMVAYMSLADLISSITTFVGDWSFESQALCSLQGFNIHLWFLVSAFWTVGMSTHCFFAVIKQRPLKSLDHYMYFYHAFAWGVPFLITLFVTFGLPAILERGAVFSSVTFWCWISEDYAKYRIALFYGPVWVVFLYNGCVYTFVCIRLFRMSKLLKNELNTQSRRGILKFVLKTAVYMGVFTINWLGATTNRFNQIINPTSSTFVLSMIQALTLPLQGFMNAIVFFGFEVFTKREEERSLLRSMIPPLRKGDLKENAMFKSHSSNVSDSFSSLTRC